MRALIGAVVLAVVSCGSRPPLPRRWVVEGDLGSWKFRRFQGPMLDVDVWVEGNKAEAYTATYVTADAEKRGRIDDRDVVNVSVTRYQHPDGVIRGTVKFARRLAQTSGYQVEEDKIGGARTLTISGQGEAWVIWPSSQHIVRVGGRRRTDVPRSVVEQYVDRYPSELPGGALEGPLPPGPGDAPDRSRKLDKPAYDPANPRPDAEHYDPSKVKLPEPAAEPDDVGEPSGSAGSASRPADPARPRKPRRSK